MSLWTALVAIVAIVAFAAMRIARYNSSGTRSLTDPPDDGHKAALAREVEDLRERVRVLERIATDANTANALETRRVADEIEAPRDH